MLVSMRSQLGWTVLIAVWGMAFAGIIWKFLFLGRLEVIATILYLLMGWIGGIIFIQDIGNIPPLGVGMLIMGGVTYTLGVIFYSWEKLPYNHTIWHLFVLGGSICHYFAVVTLVPVL
jgi:hemolysin III